ncbi:hypothetical protein D3C81_1744410 [compost metagenome]
MALKTRRRALQGGDAGLVGSLTAVVGLQAGDPQAGWVHLQGEQWQVRSRAPLQAGQRVRVIARHGLWLEVAATDATSSGGD